MAKSRVRNSAQVAIDRHVGARLRSRRTLLGLSQQQVGERAGITFQQVQKYENGVNRIGASRLYVISGALSVPVGYFFEGLEHAAPGPGRAAPSRLVLESARLMQEMPRPVQERFLKLARACRDAATVAAP